MIETAHRRELYNPSYWNTEACAFNENMSHWSELTEQQLKILPLSKELTILDVGAGTGRIFRRYAAFSVPGGGAVKPAPTGVYRVERTGKQPASADAARAGELNRRGQPLLADLAHQPLAGAGAFD